MNFRLFFEMGDLTQRTTSSTIQSLGKEFISQFRYENQNFTVRFRPIEWYFSIPITDAYMISFGGPNEYDTTGLAGTKATAIYTQLLLIIKKFMNEHEVQGFMFDGQEPGMDLLYNRFYKKYLAQDFVKINHKEYVRRTYLTQYSKTLVPQERENFYKKMLASHRTTQQTTKEVKSKLQLIRQNKLLAKQHLGHFVWYKTSQANYLAYLYGADRYAHLLVAPEGSEFSLLNAEYYELLFEPVSPHDRQEFLATLNSGYKTKEVKEFLASPQGQALQTPSK